MFPFDAQAQPQPQQGGGLLGGLPGVNPDFMDSPLFHIGMGLLSVPQRSLDPGAVSWGPGIQQGMRSYQQQQFSSQAARERAARTKLAEEKVAEAKRAAREKERMALMQRENMDAVVATLPLKVQQNVAILLGLDSSGKRAADYVSSLIVPGEAEGPAGYKAWKAENPKGTYEDYVRWNAGIQGELNPRGTSVTVKLPSHQKPLEDKAVLYKLPDGSTPSPMATIEEVVSAGGVLKPKAEQAGETTMANEMARLQAARALLPKAFDTYEQVQKDPQSGYPGTQAYRLAADAKDNLATQIAIVESRGAEPNPNKIANVKERIPDYAGPIDRSRFDARLKQLRGLQLPEDPTGGGGSGLLGAGGPADMTVRGDAADNGLTIPDSSLTPRARALLQRLRRQDDEWKTRARTGGR